MVELGAFGFFGLFWGFFSVLLADLSGALGLSPGPLGTALFVGAAASIVAMAALGRTADRLGRRTYLVVAATVFGVGISGLALAGGYAALLGVMAILYAASGLYDVGINATAVDLEQTMGRRFMNVFHAAFSGGAMAGAISAGALLSVGLDYRTLFLGLLAPLAVLILAVATTRFPPARGRAPGDVASTSSRGLYRHLPLLLVGTIATLALGSEGEMEHWSGIYLRDTLGLSALIGGSGVAVFYGAMAAGRLGTAWVVGRLGDRRTLISAGMLTAAGMALAMVSREPVLVVSGFVVVGLALSGVAPIAFSVAGDLAPDRAGEAISVVTTLGYGGFLLGPVIVGGIAELVGLRIALLTIAAAGALIVTLGYRLSAAEHGHKPAA